MNPPISYYARRILDYLRNLGCDRLYERETGIIGSNTRLPVSQSAYFPESVPIRPATRAERRRFAPLLVQAPFSGVPQISDKDLERILRGKLPRS